MEWEPRDRPQDLAFSNFENQVAWYITNNQGQVVDQSHGDDAIRFSKEISPPLRLPLTDSGNRQCQVGSWEVGQIWIHADPQRVEPGESSPSVDNGSKSPMLSITAGVSLLPMRAMLRHLSYTLIGLSAAIWLVVFVAGRFVCRRALLPVRRMAVAAGDIHADDLAQRLPLLSSNDELDELGRAFNKMLGRLQEAFERQRRFTGDASHQLRTPLTAILGQIEVALRRERSAADYRQVLETVLQRATHLARMVESLLFLARADAEAQLPALGPLDLTTWLPLHLRSWSLHPRCGDIALDGIGSDPCLIVAQSELLGELLNILLDNACKYSEPGSPITIRMERRENAVTVKVEDHGCGIEEGELPDLFEPFCRSREARRRGLDGVGLGLSIAQRLSRVFGAELTVVSQPHQGSCFTLQFPAANLLQLRGEAEAD